MHSVVEVRCPNPPNKLLAKFRLGEETARYVPDDNTLEISCGDCSRRFTREGLLPVRALHRYNVLGELVETIIEPRGQVSTPSD